MNVLINHCWCSDSNWGGMFNCQVIVSIRRIPDGKGYHDPVTDDWKNLIEEVNPKGYCETVRLKPEVMAWLEKNVKGKKLRKWMTVERGYCEQGWCVGTDKYNSNSCLDLCVFFERQTDALNFIKVWSSHKKPTYFFNYFKDIRKKLDLKTGKMVKDIR